VKWPAIELAEQGFVVPKALEQTRDWYQDWIENRTQAVLNFSKYFGSFKAGEVFKQPELAQTLKRIAKDGAQEFYQGQTAKYLVEEYQSLNGLITMKDLKRYEAKWRSPIQFSWQGLNVISAPPPSSGGVAIAQLLGMQQKLWPDFRRRHQNLASSEEQQALQVHFYAELMKRVYADRAEYLGDSDFVEVPVQSLIHPDYLKKRASELNWQEISKTESVRPGPIESPETTHFSIVDADGNAVSNTYTLNMPFGNGVVISKAGFLMNNEMDDFSSKPGVANLFGVIGAEANAIAPRKRMLSSMSPTIVTKNGKVDAVVGTPGGSTIITSVFQALMNAYVFNKAAQESVDAPRVHHQLWPKNRISYNPSIDEGVKSELELMGYELKEHFYMGDLQMLLRQDDEWQAASDKRGRGKAGIVE
jgi:gamma-glutamyltranspeptidase/glutathione hydrolase